MARKIIDIGTVGNDGTGDSIRDSFRKVNDNFQELYSSLGLGERLKFIGLDDTPETYEGQYNPNTGSTPIVAVNDTETGLTFKTIVKGNDGITIDYSDPTQIAISNNFDTFEKFGESTLGGDLHVNNIVTGATIDGLPVYNRNWVVGASGTPGGPVIPSEAVSKSYADAFISRKGIEHVDPSTGRVNSAFGRMNGPLILSRDPIDEDDEIHDGLIAATKRYVDSAAFGSTTNIYVSTAGEDIRPNLSKDLQGSSLPYAFRTIEAALKKAEEMMLSADADIGPYKKTLTYTQKAEDNITDITNTASLSSIVESPDSGTGFSGFVVMSADTVEINNTIVGSLYYPGDILEINGGAITSGGGKIQIEVLSTSSIPGSIITFRVVSAGSYLQLPTQDVQAGLPIGFGTTVIQTAAPQGVLLGTGAHFDVTFKVNSVEIDNPGSGYGLVSVRIVGGNGKGAFGIADVVDGEISSITITNSGSGFTSLPTVVVDLPRFCLYTAGLRTDYTGSVTTNDPSNYPGRDIREGLYLKGETSGAIAQILSHKGYLGKYSGNEASSQISPDLENADYTQRDLYELFDVDIQVGQFKSPAKGIGSISGTTLTITGTDTGKDTFGVGDVISGPNITPGTRIIALGSGTGGAGTYSVNISQVAEPDVVIGGEPISYGDITVTKQISVLVESGVYEENYPLRVPRNVAIIGDEFRRVLIKPRDGISTSPWAFIKFRRDLTVGSKIESQKVDDVLTIADRTFGYHYLSDSGIPVYPKISNKGSYRSAAKLLELNKNFIAEEVVGWIDYLIAGGLGITDPDFGLVSFEDFVYNKSLCRRDVGLLIDAMVFDLRYGEYYRTVSASLKYRQNSSGLKAITEQLPQTSVAISRIQFIAEYVISNLLLPATESKQTSYSQIVDRSYVKETGSDAVVEALTTTIRDVIANTGVNLPKQNNELDVFLCNDANIIRAVTCQGHGGFMMVLDPTGQILTKSPYAQECASFSRSINKQTFAGGMYVDGFSGNLQFKHNTSISKLTYATPSNVAGTGFGYSVGDVVAINGGAAIRTAKLKVTSVDGIGAIKSAIILDEGAYNDLDNLPITSQNIVQNVTVQNPSASDARFNITLAVGRIEVSGLDRYPQLPSSFIVNDEVYRINYVRDYSYNPAGSTATLVLDETTPFSIAPGSRTLVTGSGEGISVGNPAVVTKNRHGLQPSATITFSVSGGSLPAPLVAGREYYVLTASLTDNQFRITDTYGSLTPVATTSAGSGTISYQRVYEILTPGNRSMLGNDYTQINDMGYGIVAANGGLIEAVSIFTYYCWISYYSINGGQIRSVGGSSAHGKYALVAQGFNPLEVPTPTQIYEPLSQGATIFRDEVGYFNEKAGYLIWVTNYDFTPLNDSEIEIDHGGTIGIVRYTIGAVEPDVNKPGVAKLNILTEDGLREVVANGTKVTIRVNTRVVLTNDLLDVSVRPSTGLILNESPEKVYRVLDFKPYVDPRADGSDGDPGVAVVPQLYKIRRKDSFTLEVYTEAGDKDVPFRLREGYQVIFNTTGTLPGGLEVGTINPDTGKISTGTLYYVLGAGLDIENKSFRVALTRNGDPIEITSTGSGISSVVPVGLTSVKLRESYNWIELTSIDPGEFSGNETTGDGTCTFSVVIGSAITVNASGHSLQDGDVIKFEVANRNTSSLPFPLSFDRKYFVINSVAGTSFQVAAIPDGTAIKATAAGVGTSYFYGKILGKVGDTALAVARLTSSDVSRVIGSRFVFKGEEYEILTHTPKTLPNPGSAAPGIAYSKLTLKHVKTGTGLKDSILAYSSQTTLLAGSQPGTDNTTGTLTIRISLTRVTSHDLLEIGTGSYKETNYPNEIYGRPENSANASNETQERSVGRVFYVTTDQFGNFRVGPFFAVDQGTGTVTFSASIAITNLDGLGFKLGVTVSEFSTDTSFSANALDKVPVEYATRAYIERRLGLTHDGNALAEGTLVPPLTGGFMALNGELTMKNNMDLGEHRVINVADPVNTLDAVNLQSLRVSKLRDVTITPTGSAVNGQILAFTGTGTNMVNATLDTAAGDIGAGSVDSNQIPLTVKNGAITNAKVNDSAGIEQSKLSMNKANTFVESTGWTGSKTQADLGLAKFSANNFETADGFVRIKGNGIAVAEIQQISTSTVLGNNSGNTGNVSQVAFSSVVSGGGGITKSLYGSIGVLSRTNSLSNSSDSDYAVLGVASNYSGNVDNGKIVQRDGNGDFGGRYIAAEQGFKLYTSDLIIRNTGTTGGTVRYFGYSGDGSGGIDITSGTPATDKVTTYRNDLHKFVNLNGQSAPIEASEVKTAALTTGGNTTPGTITGRWTLTGTSPNESRLQATYSADLAEYYEGDKEYPVGTVLVFGGDKEVTTTNQQGDTRVAGVVSNTAAFAMYDACPGFKNLIALQGRVPCKVVGKIRKGDILVTSRIPGVAIATQNAQAGTIVGKALGNYDSDHIGTIEVAVGRN